MRRTRNVTRLHLDPPRPFAFDQTVVSHGWYLIPPFRWDANDSVLHRVERLGNEAVELRIRFTTRLVIESDSDLSQWQDEIGARIGRMFQLHVDLSDFVALCRTSPDHQHVRKETCGRLLCAATRFEDAIKIIATTNTTWRQTVRTMTLLSESLGTKSPSGLHAFPDAAQIAAAPIELLGACRLGYRAGTIMALARGIVDGSIDLETLADPSQSTIEMMRSFQQLPGIGPYGAAHLAAMEGRFDFIAVDTEFRRFVRERYHQGRKVSDATLQRRYRKWGKWKYLAYWSELWNEIASVTGKPSQLPD
ncbi:MAG TPA: hypothetical protein VNM92_12485 [Thermoanaerobaculia bacterium]|nr:hypothetical protein [Thermoanaerobaculia bacterium]